MTLLFRNVALWAPNEVTGMSGPVDVLVTAGRIARIAAPGIIGETGACRIVEAAHHVLLPGLINAHFHSPANHLKGAFPSRPLETFMLYESPSDARLTPTPREAYLRTMLGAMEMLRNGVTSVQDDAFLMPYPTPEIIDAVCQAYVDSGIRATVALDQPELPDAAKLPFLDELSRMSGMFNAPPPMDASGLIEMYDHLVTGWHGAAGGRIRAAVSVSAPQRVSVGYFEALNELSLAHDLPVFAHILETRVQRALSDAASGQPRFEGRSLVRYTADLGLLSDRMNVIHAVWVDGSDLDLIAESGATIVHNPVSNLRLGSGVMPWRAVRDRGITLALGTDEAICDDSVNVWGVVKQAGLIHNLTGGEASTWPQPAEVLAALWEGGATAMRMSADLGRIEEGALADLVLLDLHSPAFTPFNDLRGQLVYCENGGSVKLTVVAGEIVAEDGRPTKVDERSLLDEAREVFARRRLDLANSWRESAQLESAYGAIVRWAAETDVAVNRWVR